MIYLIDHQDSFTWNVAHQFSTFDEVYCSNYFEIDEKKLLKSNVIVLSPGPGSPKDYPDTSKIYKKFRGLKKIIGICLGYQQILYNEGGKIIQQKRITMRCLKTNIAMGIEDNKNKIYGFQFHPESFLTKNGKILIKKILSA